MSFLYENQGGGPHLVYELDKNDELDTMSLGMLNNNKIPGLIPPVFTRVDFTQYIKYNVSSKISVKQFFTGTVNKKQLIGVFRGIAGAVISAEEYMINPDNIILDTEYIFSDVSTCETVLVCLPVKGAANRVDLKAFFRDIMFNTQFDQTENCDHVAKIINYLNSSAAFSVYEFKKLLDKISSQGTTDISEVKASVPQVIQEQNPPPEMKLTGQESKSMAPAMAHAAFSAPAAPQTPVSSGAGAKSAASGQGSPAGQAASAAAANKSAPKMAVPGMKTPGMNVPNFAPNSAANSAPGFAPNFSADSASAPLGQAQQDEGEKIGLMYLLQHYNKENAEKYKAQKKAKKTSKPQPAVPPINSGAVNAPNMPGAPKMPGAPSFQPAPSAGNGMAFPGQNAPISTLPPLNAPKQFSPASASKQQPGQVSVPFAPAQNGASASGAGFADFGETQYIQQSDEDSETAFLMPGAQNDRVQPYLQAKRNNERIPIIGNIFRLGRDKDFNDYVIQNNKFVGHSHCHILAENGEYFIVDDNSKNRTYVEGAPIQPGVKVKLVHGQKIRLADEEFEFRIF